VSRHSVDLPFPDMLSMFAINIHVYVCIHMYVPGVQSLIFMNNTWGKLLVRILFFIQETISGHNSIIYNFLFSFYCACGP
jgi:hypothetical protein